MGKAIVAVFDDQSDAQQALEAVIDSGFSSRNVRLTFSNSSNPDLANRPDSEESIGDKIANFFGFGDHDETYSEAVRRGGYVLTVDVDSDDESERAQDLIEEYDPIDIDEREAEWRENGWQTSREPTAAANSRGTGIRVLSRFTEAPVANLSKSDMNQYGGPERRSASDLDYAGSERRAA